jgi:hypothetical protein
MTPRLAAGRIVWAEITDPPAPPHATGPDVEEG